MTNETQTQKPTIKLMPLEKTVVNTPTRQDYTTLMRIYECGGWKWNGGGTPTLCNLEKIYEKYARKTCIEIRNDFHFAHSEYYKRAQICTVLLPEEFYEIEKVSLRDILKINRWFDQNGK